MTLTAVTKVDDDTAAVTKVDGAAVIDDYAASNTRAVDTCTADDAGLTRRAAPRSRVMRG